MVLFVFLITSPSKTQDFTQIDTSNFTCTLPEMLSEIKELVSELKNQDIEKIKSLMSISSNLAKLNFDRYQKFASYFDLKNSKPAIFAFKGDTYADIEIAKYSKQDLEFAQNHLGIISGLYGLLRPLDLIQPYRLEMGTNLHVDNKKNLYDFWGDKITNALNTRLAKDEILINLASQEYSKALSQDKLLCKFINIIFKEHKNGIYKVIGLFAKRARGTMINYVIRNKITSPEKLKQFNINGYTFTDELSDSNNFVFTR